MVLKELSDEEALEAVDRASDIDESEFIEHVDHETDSESEIDACTLEPPQASSSHHVSPTHDDDSFDVEDDIGDLGNEDLNKIMKRKGSVERF
ncbi:hypothetical protein AVEN_215653-1 [Araneus ventricosus]|uniref:Uncharacterized protein n=1 Tax=Araneus ventricosus TaxID=182803 RepID=A0A4Y2KEJ9_ARAVE|nr:hypothetical protein AVEN_215653-1 [Araneus ventricosus]